MGTSKNTDTQYAAFISYAHADEVMAARLHKALETYPVPKHLRAQGNATKPVFRDVAELTAAHSLSEKIREAVRGSRVLIVLCSPAAKASHWVNEEIRLFRELHGDASILSAIIEGTPETAFPEALTEGGREPLAANLGGRKESFNLGVTQLAASILGVRLDQLIQRDAKRRRNRFRAFTAASMGFAAIMGGMAWMAVDARDAAEVSRSEAENMVEYLITDLKKELDAVGRLSILDDVGTRVTDYYDAIPLSDMDDERLARQARARHLLGNVALTQGHIENAQKELDAAYVVTEEILRRAPNDPEAIFAHAQSEYWVGRILIDESDFKTALPSRLACMELSRRLYDIDPEHKTYVLEYVSSLNNLGVLYLELGDLTQSEASYQKAINILDDFESTNPNDKDITFKISRYRRNLAVTQHKSGSFGLARKNYEQQIDLLHKLLSNEPKNANYQDQVLLAKFWLQDLKINNLHICNHEEISLFITDFKQQIMFESKNERAKKNFVKITHSIFKECADGFKEENLEDLLTYTDNLYDSIVNKNDDLIDKYNWLSRLRTSKN